MYHWLCVPYHLRRFGVRLAQLFSAGAQSNEQTDCEKRYIYPRVLKHWKRKSHHEYDGEEDEPYDDEWAEKSSGGGACAALR